MLKMISTLAMASALVSSPVVFAETQQEAEAKCSQWAQEEKVSAEELGAYMAECVQSLTEESPKEKE